MPCGNTTSRSPRTRVMPDWPGKFSPRGSTRKTWPRATKSRLSCVPGDRPLDREEHGLLPPQRTPRGRRPDRGIPVRRAPWILRAYRPCHGLPHAYAGDSGPRGGGLRGGRLAEGRGSSILIQETDAHAWCETYLNGIGWFVADASPERTEEPPSPDVDRVHKRNLARRTT